MNNSIFKGKTLYFEGSDYSGKSHTIRKLLPYTINNNNFLSDRSIVTSIVYAKLFDRKNVDAENLENAFCRMMNSNSAFMFFLDPSVEIIKERMKYRNEDFIDKDQIFKVKELYKDFFEKYRYYGNYFNLEENDSLKQILSINEQLNKKFMNNQYLFDYYVLLSSIYNKNNHEINNYKFNFMIKNFNDATELKEGIDLIYNTDFLNLPRINRSEIYYREEYERNMVMSNLIFNTHIMIDKYSENIESRRFLSVNDSCFTFTQVNIRENDIYFTYCFRSTDVWRMFPGDLLFIYDMIREYIKWLAKYLKNEDIYKKRIHIDLNLSSAHLNKNDI